jgi:hypothetical protein
MNDELGRMRKDVVFIKLIANLLFSVFVYGRVIEITKIPEKLVVVENGINNSIRITKSVILLKQ